MTRTAFTDERTVSLAAPRPTAPVAAHTGHRTTSLAAPAGQATPLASGPRSPRYGTPLTKPQPGISPVTSGSRPPWHNQPTTDPAPVARRRRPVVLIVLLIVLTLTSGTFGALYLNAMSGHTSADAAVAAKDKELRDAQAELADATTAKEAAEAARDDAQDQAATADQQRQSAEATAQRLQACQTASQDLLTALGGDPNAPQTQQAVADALGRMSVSCV